MFIGGSGGLCSFRRGHLASTKVWPVHIGGTSATRLTARPWGLWFVDSSERDELALSLATHPHQADRAGMDMAGSGCDPISQGDCPSQCTAVELGGLPGYHAASRRPASWPT